MGLVPCTDSILETRRRQRMMHQARKSGLGGVLGLTREAIAISGLHRISHFFGVVPRLDADFFFRNSAAIFI